MFPGSLWVMDESNVLQVGFEQGCRSWTLRLLESLRAFR
jgi:hypothetical protein